MKRELKSLTMNNFFKSLLAILLLSFSFEGVQAQNCDSAPPAASQFARQANATATMNGVQVTRQLKGIVNYSTRIAGGGGGDKPCLSVPADLPALKMTGGINEVVYTFSKPITEVKVWFYDMGEKDKYPTNYAQADISVGGSGNPTVNVIRGASCSIGGNKYESFTSTSVRGWNRVAVMVKIQAQGNKPFTTLTIKDDGHTLTSYYVELCPASVTPVFTPTNACENMPNPSTYTRIGNDEKFSGKIGKTTGRTTVNGVQVTRILENDRRSSGDLGVKYSDGTTAVGDATPCGGTPHRTKNGYPIMDSNKVRKITYKFNKPVLDVELFLAEFGYNGPRESWKQNTPHIDVVKITVNNGGQMSLALRSSCTANAVTISGNQVSSVDKKTTDAKVGVSSSKPFTELVLEFLEPSGQTGGYGFYTEICLASVVAPYNLGTQCSVMPNPQFAATDKATMNGVEVTVDHSNASRNTTPFNNASPSGCKVNYPAGYLQVKKNGSLVYTFSHPVNDVEVWLGIMGGSNAQNAYDAAQISTGCDTNPTLTLLADCVGRARLQGNIVTSYGSLSDVAVKVHSDKPFTELVITDLNSTAGGYYVELCPASVKPVTGSNNILAVNQTTLTEQTICVDGTTTPTYILQAKVNGGSFLGTKTNLNFYIDAKPKGATDWENVFLKEGVVSDLPQNFVVDDLKDIHYDQAQIRARYVLTNESAFCGEIVRYSNEVKLNVQPTVTITTQPIAPITPYEKKLPNGWCVIQMQAICQLLDGEKKENITHPYLDVAYLRGKTKTVYKDSGKYIPKNTHLILVDGENSGEIFTTTTEGYQGSTLKILNISQEINKQFIFYVLKKEQQLFKESKTGSAIPHLNKKLFKELLVFLPPLQEQQRIVQQIETYFSFLEEIERNL